MYTQETFKNKQNYMHIKFISKLNTNDVCLSSKILFGRVYKMCILGLRF